MNDEQDERRASKLHALQTTATPSDRIKIAEITAATREAVARTYGRRLTEMMCARAVENVLLTEEATVSIKSNFDQMPGTRDGWDSLVKRIAEADHWIRANVVHSDASLREQLKAEFLDSLAPARKMHLHRSGDLDGAIKTFTERNMAARLEALR